MKSILSELYEGKIFPAEQYSPRSEEYRQIHQSHYKHYDNFIETLSKLEPPLDKQFNEPPRGKPSSTVLGSYVAAHSTCLLHLLTHL